jgi:hypothetical protein
MNFLWQDYLTLAEALVRARTRFAPAEARYRAAMSRAYYAAYGAARQHAREYEGYSPDPTGRDHRLLVAHYQRGPRPRQQQIALALQRLMDNRLQADYDEEIPADVRQLALASVQEARHVFSWLQQLLP